MATEQISLNLFGPPHFECSGERHGHSSRKMLGLLAYLAMRPDEPVARPYLAGLLWSESPEEQSRANLRQALSQLRGFMHDCGIDPIEANSGQVLLRGGMMSVPAQAVWQEISDARTLRIAAGPSFLEGFSARAPEFDAWAAAERRAIEARLGELLKGVADRHEASGGLSTASAAIARALRLDPLDETLHRRQIQLLFALGRSDAALAQFETCRQFLRQELDTEPDWETRELASRVRAARMKRKDKATNLGTYVGSADRTYLAMLEPSGVLTLTRMPTTDTALNAAIAAARGAGEDARHAVLAADGSSEEIEAKARHLLDVATDSRPVLAPSLAETFDRSTPYSVEPLRDALGLPIAYRIGPIERHRMLVAPDRVEPEHRIGGLSLVVLPLRDFSPSANEFSLGQVIAEEVTSRLARFGEITVAAPSAAHTCRKLGMEPDDIREKLGVHYLVDGTVFRMDDRLRVTVMVANLRDNTVVASERLDGPIEQLFEFQSNLLDRIANLIVRGAEAAEIDRADSLLTDDVGAFEWYLRGTTNHRRAGLNIEHARLAYNQFCNAIDLDPAFGRAYASRVCAAAWYDGSYIESGKAAADVKCAFSHTERDAEVQRIAGSIAIMAGDYDGGLHHLQRAVDCNPSDAYLLSSAAVCWAYVGDPQKGIPFIERALQLDPFLPTWAVEDHGVLLYSMEDFEAAVASLKRLSVPQPRALAFLAASEMALGGLDAAKATIARLKRDAPAYSADQLRLVTYYRDPAQTTALFSRLTQAGLS